MRSLMSCKNSVQAERKYPIGAEVLPEGTHFRLFASLCQQVDVVDVSSGQFYPLKSEENGYFSGKIDHFKSGALYLFRLDKSSDFFPDPASRFQPKGPFGPSQIVDPGTFSWTDEKWKGKKLEEQIFYELHVGTFTQEGTYKAAQEKLKHLVELGITTIELMPLNDFPGNFGWGYDGVNLFAPTRLYGTPDELKQLINEAHRLQLGVILDVVYNHFGPSGNFLSKFSNLYFQNNHTEWGEAINFNHPEIRRFFLTNVQYWIQEYHFDGLRLDATHAIDDKSIPHIFEEIAKHGHEADKNRPILIVAENEKQNSLLIRSSSKKGYGLDGVWNDDFHHSANVCLTGKREAYFSDYTGHSQELISCLKYGFLYQGQYYNWNKSPRGKPSLNEPPWKFITFIQNHDQIANSSQGYRLHQMTDLSNFRAMTCLLLLSPNTPLLFQGQEFASSKPFFYFSDHHKELSQLIKEGRNKFLAHFSSTKNLDQFASLSDQELFLQSKLDHQECQKNKDIYLLHRDLIRLRKTDPIFSQHEKSYDGAVLNDNCFLLRFFTKDFQDRLLLFNFGKDFTINPASIPLLASCEGCSWEMLFHSELPQYGGKGLTLLKNPIWFLPEHSAIVLKTGSKN